MDQAPESGARPGGWGRRDDPPVRQAPRPPNRPRPVARRARPRRWPLAVGLSLLALAVLAVGAVLGLAWYAEDRARTKLGELGARAGLAIRAGAIVLSLATS